jgi:tripartite ATP-independent transporter DctM subunit
MILVVIGFIVLLFIGVPVAFVLGITSILYMVSVGNLEMFQSAPQRMAGGIQNYGLLAIPLFVLVGELMNTGGITKRLVQVSNQFLGHFRGGLAYVTVLANMFLASILGSANAQTAMMTKIMVPEMEKAGYKKEFSAALTVASSLMGPIIPPSIIFIIYAVTAEVSIAGMFLAGIIPGILLGISFIILIYFIGKKENFPKSERATFSQIKSSFLNIIPALSIPIVIIMGILTGLFTATESAAVACLIAFLTGIFVYRELKLRDIPQILVNTAMNSAIVTFIVAMATIFGWVLSFERVPQLIAESFLSITSNPLVFLLLCNILFLLLGMIIEGMAAIIILVPVLLPVAVHYGVDPIQFGIILCVNLSIGLITPPVGTCLFIASSITKITIERLTISLFPFIGVALIVLLLITFVPSITMWIPNIGK